MQITAARQVFDATLRVLILEWYVNLIFLQHNLNGRVTASKEGRDSRLAVADEEGTINIFNTARRQDWDGG